MSDSDTHPFSSLLSSFALGPSWARATGSTPDANSKPASKAGDLSPRRDDRRSDDRRSDDRRSDDRRGSGLRDRDGGNRPFPARGRHFDDRREAPPRHEEAPPAEGVQVTLIPDAQAIHLIGKEILHVARVYELYDVAKILLAERARCRAVFDAPLPHPPMLRGKIDDSLFLTRDEALRHLWQSELRNQFIEEETLEVDPPTGNFQSVARCGMSGEWLGPPNFHAYQINLRRIHRERFAHLPFAVYSSRVRTERGEEAVNAWLETTKQKTRWRIKGDADDAWLDDRADAQRALAARCFDQAFAAVHTTEVLASVAPANLSAALLTSLKLAGNHARNHPATLIPAVCRAVEAEHLPVFKRQGKLLTGPARPHPLPPGAILAERPGIMVAWIRANKPAKLEGLWRAVLPEGSTAPPSEYAADLFWLLHQGHILLFTDDTLHVQEPREAQAPDSNAQPKAPKTKKKRAKKPRSADSSPADEAPAHEATPEMAEPDVSAVPDVPDVPAVSNVSAVSAVPAVANVSDVSDEPVPTAETPVTTPVQVAQTTPAVTEDDELSKIPSPGVDVHPSL